MWVLVIVGAHAYMHHGQRPQEYVLPQCKYHGSVKPNDTAAISNVSVHGELIGLSSRNSALCNVSFHSTSFIYFKFYTCQNFDPTVSHFKLGAYSHI